MFREIEKKINMRLNDAKIHITTPRDVNKHMKRKDASMFSADIYSTRRQRLKADVDSGLILFPGNGDSPINAMDNCYAFRQDSSFCISGA